MDPSRINVFGGPNRQLDAIIAGLVFGYHTKWSPSTNGHQEPVTFSPPWDLSPREKELWIPHYRILPRYSADAYEALGVSHKMCWNGYSFFLNKEVMWVSGFFYENRGHFQAHDSAATAICLSAIMALGGQDDG